MREERGGKREGEREREGKGEKEEKGWREGGEGGRKRKEIGEKGNAMGHSTQCTRFVTHQG